MRAAVTLVRSAGDQGWARLDGPAASNLAVQMGLQGLLKPPYENAHPVR
jgi:hypothetical protein